MRTLVAAILFAPLWLVTPAGAADTPAPQTPATTESHDAAKPDPSTACACGAGKGPQCCAAASAASETKADAAPHPGCGCRRKRAGS